MSIEWQKYTNAERCLQGALSPNENGIVEAIVIKIRVIPLSVIHNPYDHNQAHANVKNLGEGVTLTNNRLKLHRVFSEWSIPIQVN